jgi:cell division protein FtsX
MKNTLKNIFTIIVFMFIIVSFSGCFNNSEKHKDEIKEEIKEEIKKELEEENESLRKSNTIIVYLNEGLSDKDIALIKSKLENTPGVESIQYTSKEKALEDAKEMMKDEAELLNRYTSTNHPFPASFQVVLKDKSYCDRDKTIIKGIDGVKDIKIEE